MTRAIDAVMETGSFETNVGLNIFYRYWPSIGNDKNVILCIHGIAGDSRIFNYFAGKVSSLGHNVYAIDLPGFGMSEGEKGDMPFDTTMKCLHDIVTKISNKHGTVKIFLLGFSLGGMYALWYASLHQEMLRGVIGLAPHLRIEGVERNPRSEPAQEVILHALQKYSTNPAEKVHIGMAVPNAFGELAGEEWIYMLKDPVCNFNYSYRYIFEVLIGRAEKIDPLYKIKLPLLILHGDQDWITVPEQSRTILQRVESTDKQLKILDDSDHWFYHAVFYEQKKYSEKQRSGVINVIDEWVRRVV